VNFAVRLVSKSTFPSKKKGGLIHMDVTPLDFMKCKMNMHIMKPSSGIWE
jgi:hypothetical protein